MYYNKVEICGVNTSELPVLKEAEKTELLKKTKEGDKNARQKLISGNFAAFLHQPYDILSILLWSRYLVQSVLC